MDEKFRLLGFEIHARPRTGPTLWRLKRPLHDKRGKVLMDSGIFLEKDVMKFIKTLGKL